MAKVIVLKPITVDGVLQNPGDALEIVGPALENLIRKGCIEIAPEPEPEPVVESDDESEPEAKADKSKKQKRHH